MQCPNCQQVEDDAAAECSRCGFILAKWRARVQQAQEGKSEPAFLASKIIVPQSESSIWGTLLWVALLGATAGVWALNRSGQEQEAARVRAVAAENVASSAASAIPENTWRFEGHVTDLLRGSPIKGVKVSFLDFETGYAYADSTDDEGHYSVDVPIHWRQGYAADITEPLYLKRYWTGPALAASRKERLKMGLEPPDEVDTRPFRGGKKKVATTFDFALFPQYLTDEERQEAAQ